MLQVSIRCQRQVRNKRQKFLPSADALEPQPKSQTLTSFGVVLLSRGNKQDQVYNDICLPRPGAGNLVYSAAKATSAVWNLVKSNNRSSLPVSGDGQRKDDTLEENTHQ